VRKPARRNAENDECGKLILEFGGAVAQLGARLDGIEEVVGSNPIGSTNEELPKTLTVASFSIFLLHSNMNLSGLPRKIAKGPFHSYRAHQY
jgi:hypothetical protein